MDEIRKEPRKPYSGIIWNRGENQPGERFVVLAVDSKDARRLVEEQYGSGHVYTLQNSEEANKPR